MTGITAKGKKALSPALKPLDEAAEYLRRHGGGILPLYLIAIAPMTAAVFYLIDAVSSYRYSDLPKGCFFLTIATLWRWGWLAEAQRRVQESIRGKESLPLRSRIFEIMLLKLISSLGILWGSIAVFPSLYGFFLSGFTAPLLLEGKGHAMPQFMKALNLTHSSLGRVVKVSTALSVAFLLALTGVSTGQYMITDTLLASFLGLDTDSLSLTMNSVTWDMFMFYFLFLIFDLYWTVASVTLYYDLQSRRLGSDLHLRMRILRETNA